MIYLIKSKWGTLDIICTKLYWIVWFQQKEILVQKSMNGGKNLEILNMIPFPKDLLGKFEDHCIKQYKNSTNIISTKNWIYNFSINIFNSRLWLFLWPSLKINFNYPNPHNYCGPTSFIANFAQVYFQVCLPTTMKTGHQVPEQKTRRILVTCASKYYFFMLV